VSAVRSMLGSGLRFGGGSGWWPVLGVVASLVALVAVWSGLAAPVEGFAVDSLVRLRGERPADRRIVLCLIDGPSIDTYGRWPWPRTVIADLVDRLAAAGARTIAFDVVFSEPSRVGEGFDLRTEDVALADAIERAGNVVLSFFFQPEGRAPAAGTEVGSGPFRADPGNLRSAVFDVIAGDPAAFPVPTFPAAEPNLDLFAAVASSQGFTTNERESGVSRRQGLAARFRGEIYPALPLRAVQRFLGEPLELARDRRGLPLILLGGRPVEVDGGGRLWVSYPGGAGSFRTVSVRDVLEDGLEPGALDGALVFFGASEVGVGDFTATPFGTEVPGVVVQAVVAENLLTGSFLREAGAPRLLSFLALVLMGPLVALLVAAVERYLVSSLVAIGVVLAWPAAAFLAFVRLGWHLEIVGPMAAGVLALVVSLRYQVGTVDARARFIRRTFERYVSQAVVDEMLRHPERVRLGGERRELTVLFSDIRGFTSISERLAPDEVAELINSFFTPMTRVVLEQGGTLDKYMGDALMAFFGAPVVQEDHAARACRAALAMAAELDRLNERWRSEGRWPEGMEVGVGIGLNTGPMSVGNMGSEQIFDYTVLGDHVNLGSRVEGLNKLYRTGILVTGATVKAANRSGGRPRFLFRELDRVRVKGRSEPVAVHELLAEHPAPAELERLARRYGEALALYRGRRFAEAETAFRALDEATPGGDPPAAVLAERCRRLATEGAPADWEPVETPTSK